MMFAILPIGSFEQHEPHLPMDTDTQIAVALSKAIHEQVVHSWLLPPITISCSHEHASIRSVSVHHRTFSKQVEEIYQSIQRYGYKKLLIVNCHGGNYVLSHIAQEQNIDEPNIIVFPTEKQWKYAKDKSGYKTPQKFIDMHGGELETSLMLYINEKDVQVDCIEDVPVTDLDQLLWHGTKYYTKNGTVGFHSLASRDKGEKLFQYIVQIMIRDIFEII